MEKPELSRVEILLAEADSSSNEALKSALIKHAEAEKLVEEKRLLQEFTATKAILTNKLDRLRSIRAKERKALKEVTVVDTALTQFKTDGDYKAFIKVIDKL